MSTRRETILTTVDDLVLSFLYYDRKEDRVLPNNAIEAAITAGEIMRAEIVERFQRELDMALSRK